MQDWLDQNPDVPSVEVGITAQEIVTVKVNCGREYQDFLDLYGATLPRIIWDHADVVALDVGKCKKFVECAQEDIVQAQIPSC